MTSGAKPGPASRLRQVVPFLRVASMEASLRFYIDGLGFETGSSKARCAGAGSRAAARR